MKNLFLMLLLLSASLFASAQAPVVDKYAQYSQMWNTSSAYYFSVTPANLGPQLDTVVNTATLNLRSSTFNTTTDSFKVSPLGGWGSVTLTSAVYKCTGTPTVNVTPIESSDGLIWGQIPGTTVVTITPTSLTVPVVTKFHFDTKPDKFVGLQITGSASSTVMAQGWYYFLKPYVAGNN